MKILAVNCGSSSLKFKMYEMPEEDVLISGLFERIGEKGAGYSIKLNGEKYSKEIELPNHKVAFEILVDELKKNNIIKRLDEIKGIGHRIVQGGDYFDKTVVADMDAINKIDELAMLAPLHNKAAITGINAAKEVIPTALETVTFDTAFHQTIEPVNYLYAVPYEWYTDYKVRKYGAHGTSHKYIASRLNALLGRTNTKLITCHIGSGASISAIRDGICIDTSMGLTPNAGLIMGTRCGDVDTSIVTYIMGKTGMSPKEMDTILNKKSGMVVHPAAGHFHGTLVNALLYKYPLNSGDRLRPGIVHRLDKDTSGVMIVAKNEWAHEKLALMISKKEVERKYLAIISGVIKNDSGTIDAPIGRDRNNRQKMAVTDLNGKEAITHFRVLERFNNNTLIECKLETGRTHQIRVHMAYIGYPVFNDPLYGRGKATSFGQMLHSYSIKFNHPRTGKELLYTVDPPVEFQEELNRLRNSSN